MNHKRILIVAITRMGDLLQASPTIVGLKREYPDSKITILVDIQFASICKGIPGIDEVYVIDMNFLARGISTGEDQLVEVFHYVSKMIDDLRANNFDYCLNMSNSAYTALLIKMLNITKCKGWLADDEGFRLMSDPWAMLFSAFVYHSNRDFNELNLVDIFRSAAEVTSHPRRLSYTISQSADDKVSTLLPESFLSGDRPLIGIQVGASQEKRQWSPKRFAILTKYLIEDLDANIFYTGAPSESPLVDLVQSHFTSDKAVSLVGKTSIEELGAVLKRANVLVTGDTGPMHLSVAVGTPVVALFLASALCFETGPYGPNNFVVQPQISCNPCNPNFPCARPDCHDYISPELMAYLTKLRIQTPFEHDPYIQIPYDIAPPGQVRVYRSDFDEDGYLQFVGINGLSSNNGYELGYLETARAAYRVLWKEEFASIPSGKEIESWSGVLLLNEETEDILNLCEDANKVLKRLIELAEDPNGPAQELQVISDSLTRIDLLLEQISLTFPILGAIVRIFIMEKENLRGDDIFILSEKSLQIYASLERRIINFQKYYSYFSRQFMTKELETDVTSISR